MLVVLRVKEIPSCSQEGIFLCVRPLGINLFQLVVYVSKIP
jgi:hypothetical protein